MSRRIRISLGTKFALTFASLFLLTMLFIMFGIRQTIVDKFSAQYDKEAVAATRSVQLDLLSRLDLIRQQLRKLATQISKDNEFRLQAVVLDKVNDVFVVDYAGKYMPTMGLQVLEIVNNDGVVLSSGHDRNSFGKSIAPLMRQLETTDTGLKLAWFETASNRFLALIALETLRLGNERFHLLGGIEITPDLLHDVKITEGDILVVKLPDAEISSLPKKDFGLLITNEQSINENYSIGRFWLTAFEASRSDSVSVYLLHQKAELTLLLNDLNRGILIMTGIGMFVAVVLSVWLTRSVAKPLQRLAYTASNLSPESLEADFFADDNDEVGVLGEALENMLRRLRRNRLKLAVAEKKAAFAEVARQVNHDIKNGFIPIRHVMQHWQEVAKSEPETMVRVFEERKSTVIESINYLENLARTYSRLHQETKVEPINVNEMISGLLKSYGNPHDSLIRFKTSFTDFEPYIQADAVQMRRAFENILQNAIEAIDDHGEIAITTTEDEDSVQIIWEDSGCGIPEEILTQLFTSHVTTKENGTGLGLANVKRIVEEFDGSIQLDSEVGVGTKVQLNFPQMKGVDNEFNLGG